MADLHVVKDYMDKRFVTLQEDMDGINVIRSPVLFRMNKGVIMPFIGWQATREVLSDAHK